MITNCVVWSCYICNDLFQHPQKINILPRLTSPSLQQKCLCLMLKTGLPRLSHPNAESSPEAAALFWEQWVACKPERTGWQIHFANSPESDGHALSWHVGPWILPSVLPLFSMAPCLDLLAFLLCPEIIPTLLVGEKLCGHSMWSHHAPPSVVSGSAPARISQWRLH